MKFDAYEYIGVIVPGSILIVTLATLFPELMPMLRSSLSLGDLGLVIILAFVAGHLLQALGNLWEKIIWFFCDGMPTTWVAKSKTSLLADAQLERLNQKLKQDFSVDRTALKDGRGPMREIFVRIQQGGMPDRIEKFNRNYGLMRGIAVGFLAAAVLTLFADLAYWKAAIGLCLLAGIATYRMIRFGTHYAREVFVEFLSLPPKEGNSGKFES